MGGGKSIEIDRIEKNEKNICTCVSTLSLSLINGWRAETHKTIDFHVEEDRKLGSHYARLEDGQPNKTSRLTRCIWRQMCVELILLKSCLLLLTRPLCGHRWIDHYNLQWQTPQGNIKPIA